MTSEPDSVNVIMQIVILIVLTLINAFFAASEMALVSLNKTRIKILAEGGNKKANKLLKILEEPNKFISTIQVGITLAGFFSSAAAATGLSETLGSYLTSIGLPYGEGIAFVGVTIILSYITLVFGELFPKRVALSHSEKIAMISVNIIDFVSKITNPFVKILSFSTSLLVKITGIDKGKTDDKVTMEEIKSLIRTGEEHGTINGKEKGMLEGIFKFEKKKVEKIMTPRTEVYCININEPLSLYIDELLEKRFSKIPVYEDDIDNIIGVLYIKDFVIYAKENGFDNIEVKEIMKEPYFVPEINTVKDVFNEMQSFKKQMAIIIDEYGGFSGIVTIEDITEEIMGEIEDEFDNKEDCIELIKEKSFLVDGVTTLEEINDRLNLNLYSENMETISGFLIDLIGGIPVEEEEKIIEYNNIIFKIEEVNEKRIMKVIINI